MLLRRPASSWVQSLGSSLFRDPARSTSRQQALPLPATTSITGHIQHTVRSGIPCLPKRTSSNKFEAGDWLRPLSGEGTTPWSLFGGCDQSLIQVTARPSGRDSTWFLQSWFSLDPTTRHYPFFEIDHDTGCGRLSLSLCSLVKDSLALETLWLQ